MNNWVTVIAFIRVMITIWINDSGNFDTHVIVNIITDIVTYMIIIDRNRSMP